MNERKYTIKLLTPRQSSQKNEIYIEDGIDYYTDKIMLHSTCYEEIFRKKLKDDNYLPSKRGIVKIRYDERIIYRMFRGHGHFTIAKDEMGLTRLSMNLLNLEFPKDGEPVFNMELKKGSKFNFYWQHPRDDVRVACKMGFLAILLAIISIGLAIIPFIIQIMKQFLSRFI